MTIKWMITIGRIGIVTLVIAASAASAGVIYSFSGTITHSDATGQAPADVVLEGDAFAGRLVYTPENMSNPSWNGIMYATFSNGVASWGSEFGANNFNGNAVLGGYNLTSGRLTAPGVTPSVHHDDEQAFFAIPDVISWPELPDELDLNRFIGGEFEWYFMFPDFMDDSDGRLFLAGTVDRLVKVTVPEPSALALLGMGLMLLVRPKAKRT